MLARILHVADAFEAMTAARPYRMTPLTAEQALSELRKFAGIQFDPVVVDAFVKTHYVHDVPDAGRHVQLPPQPIPLIGQAAAHIVAAGRETTAAPVEQA
jgi:HD-GYP domain-containing protein (c-di-GMP phosphodiesterase class II)